MDVASRSRSRVEERLSRLEAEFGTPDVTQTTFEVGQERYQRAIERSRDGQLEIHAVVRDDAGRVLLREGDGGWMIPRGQTRPDERLPAAVRRIVRETVDVDCSVTGACSANIHGIRNSDDDGADTVYRLSVVFTAEIANTVEIDEESVRWDSDADAIGGLV